MAVWEESGNRWDMRLASQKPLETQRRSQYVERQKRLSIAQCPSEQESFGEIGCHLVGEAVSRSS